MAEEQSNIKHDKNVAIAGINMDLSINQIPKGVLTYALNAAVENFDSNSTSYQNEPGNTLCCEFPEGYHLVGTHFINEQGKHVFFLVNPEEGKSEVGFMLNNDCVYHTYINADCLNFDINNPIPKIVHKITNCTTEIYWPDKNARRFLDLENPPYVITEGSDICTNIVTSEIDCNKLKVQTNFKIPTITITDVVNGGNLTSGTVQFAVQYCDVASDAYTSYYSVTNPLSLADSRIITPEFNYPVGKSVLFEVSNIDVTGYFKYFNIAVIKTVNSITSVELIGTYFIDDSTKKINYNGQNQTQVKLTIADIFEKYPYYEVSDDVTFVQDILVWKGLTSIDRINYQQIASKITLQWETFRIPATEDYSNELNTSNYRGQLRDEVYPYEICFLLDNGKQTDGFHIPGRVKTHNDTSKPDILSDDPDFIGSSTTAPYWETYNTAFVTSTDPGYTNDPSYKGPYQSGEFAYWESSEVYPCNTSIWGDLAGQPIRHHKFPDVNISPIFETSPFDSNSDITPIIEKRAVFPIGVKISVSQIKSLIAQSDLTTEQKNSIIGFKILRGDRSTNKSIVAKGILRNIGKYEREGQTYFFPNYPYNDLSEDPFILKEPNAYSAQCNTYKFTVLTPGNYQYTKCTTNTLTTAVVTAADLLVSGDIVLCSITIPKPITCTFSGTPTEVLVDTYSVTTSEDGGVDFIDPITELSNSVVSFANKPVTVSVKISTIPSGSGDYKSIQIGDKVNLPCAIENLSAFETDDSKYRQVFNSPETSFGQPFLGSILRLESAIFGSGAGHFVEVKKNALYKLLTREAQIDALDSSALIADISGTFNQTAMFTAYQAYLQIYINGITRRNYGWSYNSIASYNYSSIIPNGEGVKQRKLDIVQYLIPGVQSVGDTYNINNYQRESSIYLRTDLTKPPLPYPNYTPSLLKGGTIPSISDSSRFVNSDKNCAKPNEQFDIKVVSYYASIKNSIPNQWGQIYSYETIDTGTQVLFSENRNNITVFGGDTFINAFSFKTKLPFFIDNRVNAPDDSDVLYDEIGNVAYPKYWHSSRSILSDYDPGGSNNMTNIISIKAHNLDCPNSQLPKPDETAIPSVTNPGRTFYDGKMYMFAYGIPTFYVESSVNVDLRQAFNSREGEFYPHVSTGIPDDWVQESFVSIINDNTYNYNVTFSKQNRENYFSHLPINWEEQLCYTNFPFRAIFSEKQESYVDNRINSWLIYKPVSFFDFPQNYGNFTSVDGIENRQVLARFDNKSLLYNALYTTQTNTQGQVYLGQSLFSSNTPPLDYAETDLGYVGSQHKFLLKIPQGQVSVDAKRGQVFLLQGNKVTDLSGFGSGLNRFFTDHLAFEILRYYPNVDVDNHFKGIGLHGVFDTKYERIIISKLDYIPLSSSVLYDEIDNSFYINRVYPQSEGEDLVIREVLDLSDTDYFCNKSWTVTFNMNTMSWISFHSYIPNWYIAEHNFFYSGINDSCDLEAIAATILDCTLEGFITSCTIEGYALKLDLDCALSGNLVMGGGSFLEGEGGEVIIGENGGGFILE